MATAISTGGTTQYGVGASLTTIRDDRGTPTLQSAYDDFFQGNDMERRMGLVQGIFCGVLLAHIPSGGSMKSLTRGCLLSWVRAAASFMGNLSVKKDQPGFAPQSIAQCFYSVLKKDDAKDCPFPVGAPFQGNAHQCLKDVMTLDGRSQYVIGAVPIAYPVGFGVPGIPVGFPSDEVEAFFTSVHASGPLWYKIVCEHEEAVGQAILDNLTTLAAVLPCFHALNT